MKNAENFSNEFNAFYEVNKNKKKKKKKRGQSAKKKLPAIKKKK